MAYDKVVDSSVLDAGLKQIADAIREKGGTSDNLAFPDAMAVAIAAIEADGGSSVQIATGSYTPTEDVILSSDYLFSHNAGFEPRLFIMYDEEYDHTYTGNDLVAICNLKDINITASENEGSGVMCCVTYNSTPYSRAKIATGTSEYFGTKYHNSNTIYVDSYNSGRMVAGRAYRWFAFSDWSEV